MDNPKESTKKLLELINKSRKVAGYNTNIQKSITVLYTRNEQPENELRKSHLQRHQKE